MPTRLRGRRTAVRPSTTDPAAMMREGWHEPERVFPPPPVPILEGKLEDRAFEILELIVGIYRISQHETVMGRGVSWTNVQRWYRVDGSQEMRYRIYAAIAFLVAEGYLRDGPATGGPTPPGLKSDFYVPTEKGYTLVDRRQSNVAQRLWKLIDGNRLPALGFAAFATAFIGVLIRFLFGLDWGK